ncbi:MAG: nucleotide-binding protein [Ignavibacteriales bacterium]|nr:nucleotide-binding protein [Ignavibacteriales bacterium]
MPNNLIQTLEQLVTTGTQLVPLGGFEFSGYNARLQNKYLEWRKACLEIMEQAGPIGFTYKSKILGDANGGYFFQASAQLIFVNVKELYEKLKASPELATAAPASASVPVVEAATQPAAQAPAAGGARVLKPPPKPAGAQPTPQPVAAPAPVVPAQSAAKKVYVIGELNDPLRQQLAQFLDEIGLQEVPIDRHHGEMIDLEHLEFNSESKYAFFIFNSDDLTYAMFELGHFVGRLGKNHVCVLHMTDVAVPKNIPGVLIRSIVVKLEEASLGIMKDLKGAGYTISL